MPKLSDTQLVILTAAAKRETSAALPPPASLKTKGRALTAVLKSLLKRGLLEERPATASDETWREGEDGRPVTLAITSAGLEAIGIEVENFPEPAKQTKATKKPNGNAGNSTVKRAGTKQALLIDLLRRKDGTTLAEMIAATGWQAHSVRGAMSAALKKKLGLTIVSEKTEGRGRVYRIAAGA